ncbi:MAG: hypothetical protein HYX84_00210 [Chloroflexi bacterium]|nr:hypothetical protein [Chloroflexota bacterium]
MVSGSGAGGESLKELSQSLDLKRPQIRDGLLLWAANNPPRYPWREAGRTPYEVFIGEFWLRESPPETVIPAYNATLQAFPSFQSLAEASKIDLADALASLDLEEHTRTLKSTVDCLSLDGKGKLPADSETYLRTCGLENHAIKAIMCFGYDLPVSVVDGNAFRMLSHLFKNTFPRQPSAGFVQALAESLLPEPNPQRYNGAFLDVAEQFCQSEPPRCGQCPLVGVCDHAMNLSRNGTAVSV